MILFKKIYYKECTHVIMEAYKSQGLQGELTSWRPREPKVEFQSKSEGWKTRRADGIFPVWRLAGLIHRMNPCFSSRLKAGRSQHPSLKAVRQEEFFLTWMRVSPSILCRPSTDWMRPTHIKKGNLLYSVYWVKCQSHYTHTHTHTQWNITQPLKKNGIMPFAATWMDLEVIILSEVSQKEKDRKSVV